MALMNVFHMDGRRLEMVFTCSFLRCLLSFAKLTFFFHYWVTTQKQDDVGIELY